jgi:hypothetical protein
LDLERVFHGTLGEDAARQVARVIPDLAETVGAELTRIVTDAGYKGYHAPQEGSFQVYVAGRTRGLSAAIKRAGAVPRWSR